MTSISPAAGRVLVFALVGLLSLAAVAQASAQFQPPSTVFGSIADSEGTVEAGLPVEAYIGDTLCGKDGKTEFTGDGSARVTVYVVDVVDESQTPGCGRRDAGTRIRIKVGDRFAEQTAVWNPGPVQLDLTFGNATPVAIPTFTPAPTRTPAPGQTPQPGQTAGQTTQPNTVGTIPPGSPGAGSPVATPRGGVSSATPGAPGTGGDDGDGGIPIWAIVLVLVGGVAAVGGGVGYAMSRSKAAANAADDEFPPLD